MEPISQLNWTGLAWRGALAVVLGLVAFIWPGITLTALVYLFALYALLDGIFSISAAMGSQLEGARWWLLLFSGIAGVIVAVLAVIWPITTLLVLVYWMAAWAIVTGGFEIAAAIRLRRIIEGEWLMALSGIISIVFGILVVIYPLAGALTMAWLFGFYLLLAGFVLLGLAWRLRKLDHQGLRIANT